MTTRSTDRKTRPERGAEVPNRILWRRLEPTQLFVRLQLPFVVALTLLALATVVAVPELHLDGPLALGTLIGLAASGAFFLYPRSWIGSAAIILIPVLDIVAVALIRSSLYPYLPTVGMLCLFPFAWIAYRFPWPGLLVVAAGGALISATPFVLGTVTLSTPLATLNVITLPAVATAISVGVHLAAVSFRAGREEVTQANETLRQAVVAAEDGQRLLRSVIDTVDASVAYYDASGELVVANDRAYELATAAGFALDSPPYSGSHVMKADKRTHLAPTEQMIPRALRGELVSSHLEWIGEAGSQVAVLASAQQVVRSNGDLLGTVVAAYDVTELAHAIEIREEFLATVSHELRTPLTSIIGYTELVTETLGDDVYDLGVARALTVIRRNAETLSDRVGQLLTAAPRRLELNVVEGDLAVALRRTAEPLTVLAERAGQEITVDLPSRLWVKADVKRLAQAAENLLSNAVKYTPRGGSIALRASRTSDDEVTIEVRDTGIGMTAEEQSQVFARFYRARRAKDEAIPGLGIGLSVVDSIVRAHDGRIEITSSPGQGSTFALRLPAMLTGA